MKKRLLLFLFAAMALASLLARQSNQTPAAQAQSCSSSCQQTVCTNWYMAGDEMPSSKNRNIGTGNQNYASKIIRPNPQNPKRSTRISAPLMGNACRGSGTQWNGCCWSYGTVCVAGCEANLKPTALPTSFASPTPLPTATRTPLPTATQTPLPTATRTPTPLAGTITIAADTVIYLGPQVGQPAQELTGTVSGGSAPYSISVKVKAPDGTVQTYNRTGSSWKVDANNSGDPYFGTTQKGQWTAWAIITDSAAQTRQTVSVYWNVDWFPVQGVP